MSKNHIMKNEYLELLIDNHTNPMVLSDLNGDILAINDKLASVLGKPKDQLIGYSGFQHIGKHVIKPRKEAIKKVIKTKKPVIFEDEDKGRWWKTEVKPIFDEDRNVILLATYIKDITEKREIDEKYKDLSKQITFLNDNIADVIMQVTLSGKITYINPTCERIAGFKQDEVIGKRFTKFAPIIEIPRYFSKIQEMRSGKKITNFETKVVHKNGNIIPVEFSGQMVIQKKKKYFHAVMRDISKRKNTEKKLKESEEKFRMLSDQSLMGIIIIQGNQVKYVNEAIKSISGYSREEILIGGVKVLSEIIHPDYLAFVLDQLKKKLAGDKNVVNRYPCKILTKTGELKWVEIFSKTIKYERKNADFITFVDITSLKNTEEILKESEEKLRNIINHSDDLYYIHDTNQKITYVSPQSKKIFGYTPDEMKIKWTTLASDNPMNEIGFKLTNKAISTGMKQDPYILEANRKDGEKILVRINESPLKDDNGNVKGITGVLSDITDLKRAESEIIRRKNYLQNIIDSTSDLVISFDKNMEITTWNQTIENITGLKKNRILGKKPFNKGIFEEEEKLINYIQNILDGNNPKLEELILKSKMGEKHFMKINTNLIKNQNDETIGILLVGNDITSEINKHDRIIPGVSYLVTDKNKSILIDMTKTYNYEKKAVLMISKDIQIENGEYIDYIEVKNPDNLVSKIKSFSKEKKEPIILLDRVDYLITYFSFAEFMKIIYKINDIIKKHRSNLIMRVNPDYLEKERYTILKEEFMALPIKLTDEILLDENLSNILKYVYDRNQLNEVVTYTKISKKFSISRVTNSKRIEELKKMDLINVRKIGKSKHITTTDKGKRLIVEKVR